MGGAIQHYRDILIWCCEAVQFVVILLLLWQVYYGPSPDQKTKVQNKRLVIFGCCVLFVSYLLKMTIEHLHQF